MTKEPITDSACADRPALEITPAMIEAGIKVLRESGRLAFDSLADECFMLEVLQKSLAARAGSKRSFQDPQSIPQI